MCNTKTNSLGKEIKSTTTDSATVNQLPQSGICWETTLGSPSQSKSMIVVTTILTDWNHRLKPDRCLPAYSSAVRTMLDGLDLFVGKRSTEVVSSAPLFFRKKKADLFLLSSHDFNFIYFHRKPPDLTGKLYRQKFLDHLVYRSNTHPTKHQKSRPACQPCQMLLFYQTLLKSARFKQLTFNYIVI